jgi:hypothetical protein
MRKEGFGLARGHATSRASHSKSVDSLLQPERQHFVQCLPHIITLPVQIGLGLPKYVQVLVLSVSSDMISVRPTEFPCQFVKLPGRACAVVSESYPFYTPNTVIPENVLSQLLGGTRLPCSSSFPGLQKYQSLLPKLGSLRARLDV